MSDEAQIIAKGDGTFMVMWTEQVESDRWEMYGRDFQTREEATAFVRSKGMELESEGESAARKTETALDPTVDFLAGVAYAKAEHWEDAVRAFESATRGNPDDSQTRHYLGVAYCQLERLEEGARELEAAVRLDPKASDARRQLGIAYIRQGQHQEAARELEAVVRLKPSDGEAHFILACAYGGLENISESLREAHRAVELGYGPAQELLKGME